MKIWAFPSIYPYDLPEYRSKGIFAHRQNKALIQHGAQLSVIQPVSWHPGKILSKLHPEWQQAAALGYPYKRVHDNIEVFHPRIKNLKPSRWFTKSYTQRYVEAVEKFFSSNNITLSPNDIFYAQWIPEAYHVMHAAQKMGVRFAVMVIGDDVLILPNAQKGYTDILREVWTSADLRLSVADYLAIETNKVIGADLTFHTIHRGTDYDFFKPVSAQQKEQLKKDYEIPAGKTVILCIGTAILGKGWLDLFAALQKVKASGTDFLLVGVCGGASQLDLPAEAAKMGLSDDFKVYYDVLPGAINDFYNLADVFCLASHSEGIANVVVEAMASGLPVITTNVSGHPELIRSRDIGILVPPHQPGILSEGLSAMIVDKEKRELTGKNAREYIIKEWGSVASNAKKLYEILSHNE